MAEQRLRHLLEQTTRRARSGTEAKPKPELSSPSPSPTVLTHHPSNVEYQHARAPRPRIELQTAAASPAGPPNRWMDEPSSEAPAHRIRTAATERGYTAGCSCGWRIVRAARAERDQLADEHRAAQ